MIEVKAPRQKTVENTEKSLRSTWDRVKRSNMHVMGVPEEEKRMGQRQYDETA